MSRIHAQSVLRERVLCPYCGKSVLGFHFCPAHGPKVGFRYMQLNEKRSLLWGAFGIFLFGIVGWVLLLSLGVFGFPESNGGEGDKLIHGLLFGGIGLILFLGTTIATWKRLQDIRRSLVVIEEGPIFKIREEWSQEEGRVYVAGIQVGGQEYPFTDLWSGIKEGDTVRIHQLHRSKELLRVERIARGSKGRREKPLFNYPEL